MKKNIKLYYFNLQHCRLDIVNDPLSTSKGKRRDEPVNVRGLYGTDIKSGEGLPLWTN